MAEAKRVWPSAEFAVGALLLGDLYANSRLHYAVRILTIVAVSVAILAFGAFALTGRDTQFRYILTSTEGVVIPIEPLSKATKDQAFVIDWAVDSTTRLYTFDFLNYRTQFQEAKRNLTANGWKTFETSLKESGNFQSVIGYNYVATAVPAGPGKVTKEGDVALVIDGRNQIRHAWKVEFPMIISYRSSMIGKDGKPLLSEQNLKMSVTVTRVPEWENPIGLGIRAIVAE